MDYNLPTPMSDELVTGYIARFNKLNALKSSSRTMELLCKSQGMESTEPSIYALSNLLSIDRGKFCADHSMIGIKRPISSLVGTHAEGKRYRGALKSRGLTLSRSHAYACSSCIASDRDRFGFSYWRRLHQLKGINWCYEHKTPLLRFPADAQHLQPESKNAIASDTDPSSADETYIQNPALNRLFIIQANWLNSSTPIHTRAWNSVIQAQCKKLGLRHGEVGKRPTISDYVVTRLPHSWGIKHFPDVFLKQPLEYIKKFDGAGKDKHIAYPSLTCATILATLFESAQEALSLLQNANKPFALKALDSNRPAEPSDPAKLAFEMFLDGSSLSEACKAYGIKNSQVEELLRYSVKAACNPS